MPKHWIRLRGGWEWQDLATDAVADAAEIKRPVTLPIEWPEGQTDPVRLRRRFGCPPIDPLRESLSLCLEKVPGLLAVQLNGRAFEGPLDETLTLPLETFGPLLAKNVLILEVDPKRAARPGALWGQIALIVDAAGGDEEGSSQTR